MTETRAGEVFQFFQKSSVAAVRVAGGGLRVGDRIHILGNTTDLVQVLDSMQVDRQPIREAKPGDEVGIRVAGRVRPNDVIYKVAD